jgi:ribonuclease BN (tRNA processing enzyme)
MKFTVIGCGDAWGTSGRSHTCFRLDAAGACVLVDFGASALVSWHRLGQDLDDVDAIVISHLHGDHFGGLPFLLMQYQFELRRARPLVIAGPPGLRERLDRALEVFFPGIAARGWRFDIDVREIEPGSSADIAGLGLATTRVVHESGAPSTAVRLTGGGKTFVYSGDTAWTPALPPFVAGADLFVVECYSGARPVPGHIDWPRLRDNMREFAEAGIVVLDDGLVIDV